MAALVTVETVVLVLLALLVAGLLRSHAEILRRLESAPGVDPSLPPARDASGAEAFDVGGTTLWGDPVKLAVIGSGRDTLLAFLSSGCTSCEPFWGGLREAARELSGGTRLVVVTKDGSHESPTKLRELAAPAPDVPVVMSSAGWNDYRVKGSPYFIDVDGRTGRVRGEGTAATWTQVASLLRDALADAADVDGRAGDSTPERLLRADHELAAAGIEAGHPSLYGRE